MKKQVSFISLGPGDPELITIKALKHLQKADLVFCPATIHKTGKIISRAQKILRELNIDEAKIQIFTVPMSKNRELSIAAYKQVAQNIAKHANNNNIAICAQGDISFYSSAHYISDYLNGQNIDIKHIAGVPAFIAAANLANIHVVKQEEKLLVIPSINSYNELQNELQSTNTVVIMKLSQSEEAIKQAIDNFNNKTYHYFENVGIPDKEFYTNSKETILSRRFPYFSLLFIMDNAKFN